MTSGIKASEIQVGAGRVAERSKVVMVHVQGFLNRGEEFWNTRTEGRPAVFDLSRRDVIPGLTKGIEGMRVGGKRELVVSPHLAYGASGIPKQIPPNAVLRFEVELLEVRESNDPVPTQWPDGRHLLFIRSGEQSRQLPRWQFDVQEAQERAGGQITLPATGTMWRHARSKSVEVKLSREQVQEIFESVRSTFADHPTECLPHEQLWADPSEKAGNVTRDCATNALCVTVHIYERGALVLHYALRETSPVLLNARFYKIILDIMEPHSQALINEVKAVAQRADRAQLP